MIFSIIPLQFRLLFVLLQGEMLYKHTILTDGLQALFLIPFHLYYFQINYNYFVIFLPLKTLFLKMTYALLELEDEYFYFFELVLNFDLYQF